MIKSKLKPNKTNTEYPRLMQHKDEGRFVLNGGTE